MNSAVIKHSMCGLLCFGPIPAAGAASDVLDGIDNGLRYLLDLDNEMRGHEDGFF
ncbi:hypothetical protein FHW11_004307 [Pantoea agglomerans]|nr:hypothetical protein [Pantoea agglomerans]MBA8894121.1 hypothetical protein [Pantoea agglomerans]